MKKIFMAVTLMFAVGCFAQTSSGGSSNGTMGAGSSTSSSDQSGSMSGGQSSSPSGSMNGNSGSMSNGGMKGDMKGEKTLKGCIQSSNGGYALEEKHGKMVMLSGSQDLSAHVGHMVKVHGMWQNGSMNSGGSSSSMSSSSSGPNSSGSSMSNGQSFMVEKVDMVSDQCKMDKGMKKGSM